jgi:hypothetical protein
MRLMFWYLLGYACALGAAFTGSWCIVYLLKDGHILMAGITMLLCILTVLIGYQIDRIKYKDFS